MILFSLASFILLAQFDRGHVGPENMFLLGSPLRRPLHTAADPLQLKLQPVCSFYGEESQSKTNHLCHCALTGFEEHGITTYIRRSL